jgi:hypothetical protein
MANTTGKVALITGASGGIGYELAKLFAADGHDLVLVARSADALQRLATELSGANGIQARVIARDLCDPHAPDEIYRELQQAGVAVDFLVNNAGFGTFGFVAETQPAPLLEMMQVNMTALTHLTRLFLDGMIARRSGRILNVASTAAFQPGPLMAVYYATKAYVLSFSEALANELRDKGVTVTVLCPGPTLTGFQKRAQMESSPLVTGNLPVMDAVTVARIGYRGLMKGKTIVIPGFVNRTLVFGVRLGPRKLVTAIARRIQES